MTDKYTLQQIEGRLHYRTDEIGKMIRQLLDDHEIMRRALEAFITHGMDYRDRTEIAKKALGEVTK